MLETTQALEPEYVPETLIHRRGKVDCFMKALAPLSHGSTAEDVFVHAPSGAGKTTLARHALRRINQEAAPVTWGYARTASAIRRPPASTAPCSSRVASRLTFAGRAPRPARCWSASAGCHARSSPLLSSAQRHGRGVTE